MKDKNNNPLEAGDEVDAYPNKFSVATCEFRGVIRRIRPGQLGDKEYATVEDGDGNFYDFESSELEKATD